MNCPECGSEMEQFTRYIMGDADTYPHFSILEWVCLKCRVRLCPLCGRSEKLKDGSGVEKGHCRTCGKELPESQMVLCSGCFDKNGHSPGVRITAPENRSSYEVRLCPECGSEMQFMYHRDEDSMIYECYECLKCGHEQKLKDGEG